MVDMYSASAKAGISSAKIGATKISATKVGMSATKVGTGATKIGVSEIKGSSCTGSYSTETNSHMGTTKTTWTGGCDW